MALTPYDIVVIGSGPTSVAALDALDNTKSIAVVTGAIPANVPRAQLHAKIQSVAMARSETAGVAEPIGYADNPAKPLFSTAAIGGLANYWGQQIVRFCANDPWPRETFSDYTDYLAECGAVERLFTIEGGEAFGLDFTVKGYHGATPRLLVGSADDPRAELSAMRAVFHSIASRRGAQCFAARAHSFASEGGLWKVSLDDGQTITAKQILLAAGVLGDARLLQRSFPDIIKFRFSDHSPYMLYVIGLRKLRVAGTASATNFNVATIEKIVDNRCATFASVYDMSRAGLNLLLASVLGRGWPLLRKMPAPPGASFLVPVQIWTSATYDRVEIDGRSTTAFPEQSATESKDDPALSEAILFLKAAGGYVLKTSRTQPAFGYHYHGLQLQSKDAAFESAVDVLKERTGRGVLCVDAAALATIGCRPHTLTAMAHARRRAAEAART